MYHLPKHLPATAFRVMLKKKHKLFPSTALTDLFLVDMNSVLGYAGTEFMI
jgi:hypothetical protein